MGGSPHKAMTGSPAIGSDGAASRGSRGWGPARRRQAAALPILVALVVLRLHGQNVHTQTDSWSIQGQVRTATGAPIPSDISVVLEEAEGVVVGKQFVGTTGKFEFRNLTGELYRLIVTAKGFQTATKDVDMHYLASRYPDVYLIPLVQRHSGPPTSATTSATDGLASSKARKEYEKGDQARQAGDTKESRRHLEKAVADYPCYARAQTALGVVLSIQHEFPSAEAAFRKAIGCDGGFLYAYIQMAILLNVERKYEENEANLRQGLGRFPGEWELHYQLGVTYAGLKDYGNAEGEYLKAQAINPSALPAEFHVKLADTYLKQKAWAKAYAEMQSYLRSDPGGEFADETRSLMKRMESAGVVRTAEP
jgi:tetratricopeptide (TPR) repeat protein